VLALRPFAPDPKPWPSSSATPTAMSAASPFVCLDGRSDSVLVRPVRAVFAW